MLNLMPTDLLGIGALGKVTHEDFRKLHIPTAEAKMVEVPIKMLYPASADFAGYELEALWDDAAFGLKRLHEFKRITVVTESAWLRAAITLFRPLFPSEIRLFKSPELAAAKGWIVQKGKAGA